MMEEKRKCGKLYVMLDLNISSDVQDDLLLETLGGTVDLLINKISMTSRSPGQCALVLNV